MPGPYQLYLIRHGLAEERGEAWPDDAKRPLTADGIARLRRSMRGLANLDVSFDVVLTSPLIRARQTAEAIADELQPRPPIINVDGLAPGGTYQSLMTDLEKQSRRKRIALVGHEPGIGELAARLAGVRRSLEFKKGAFCRIDVDELPPDGSGTLRWFAPPRLLRALRK